MGSAKKERSHEQQEMDFLILFINLIDALDYLRQMMENEFLKKTFNDY